MIYCYFPYTLTLQAPAILSSLGGDPNTSLTLPFIPGSALRGAVARALGDPDTSPQRRQEFQKLVLDGSVCYLHAYPRAEGHRTLPTPVSFRIDKYALLNREETISAWDLAAYSGEGKPEDGAIDWPEAEGTPVSEPFVAIGAAQLLRVSPQRGSRIHQQRDRPKGRAWKRTINGREEAHGAIFVYEYLEAGQEFDGVILICGSNEDDCHNLLSRLQGHLQPPILLGRSRRGGYGGDADVRWHPTRHREVEGRGLINGAVQSGKLFRILLTSHYVGRNQETGQIDPVSLLQEVETTFSGRVQVLRKCWAFERVGGFNRKWRLEVSQVLACAAGSVLMLQARETIPLADMLAVEHVGLGERKVEGFGRVVFLEEPLQTVVLRTPREELQQTVMHQSPPELVCFAEVRLLTQALSRAIAVEAARLARGATALPTPSLLGRLRTALHGSPEQGLQALHQWLGGNGRDSKFKRLALDQLERCRIGEDRTSLMGWMRGIAAGHMKDQIRQLLRLDVIVQRSHLTSEASARQATNELDTWIRFRLIDSVLEALSRRQRAEESRP
jgi:CRISPR-associated protein Csx10